MLYFIIFQKTLKIFDDPLKIFDIDDPSCIPVPKSVYHHK